MPTPNAGLPTDNDPAPTDLPNLPGTTDLEVPGGVTTPPVTSNRNHAFTTSDSTVSEHFELRDFLASGGMGEVYYGHDTALNRQIAIKLLKARYTEDKNAVRRFREEAQITGQLQHPGIPPIHTVGTWHDGRPYLAMKLIKGNTLAEMIEDENTAARLPIFEAICQAVGYAHSRNIIHRDLKPANIMVGAFGEVQVMDWGLAKVLQGGESSSADSTASTLFSLNREDTDDTQMGTVMGTPAFMPPEQAIGAIDKVDQRSDVFGLGGILCALLTGKPPYVGDSAESTRQLAARAKLQDAYARLATVDAEPELVSLCMRCLSPEAIDRPEDGLAVAREIAALRSASDQRARQAERAQAQAEVRVAEERKRRRAFVVLGTLIAL
ncbi:MAG: serine/threonine-protein kinase, partial [Gemmataceae bacterium]